MKTVYLLTTYLPGRPHPMYIQHLTNRTWDNRKLIELTDNIEKALSWDSEQEAAVLLAKCITNERNYKIVPHQVPNKKEKPVKFTEKAEVARTL